MGMAIFKNNIIKPRYKGTVVCQNCAAEFAPGKWVRGFYATRGTDTSQFHKMSEVPADECPMCLTFIQQEGE